MVHDFVTLGLILGRNGTGSAGNDFQFRVKECQPVLLIPSRLFQQLSSFSRIVLPQKVFDSSVELLHFFVEVLKKRRITDGQVLFLTVELVICHSLNVLGLLNGRIMLRGECRAQGRELTELKQGIHIHAGHNDDNEE